MTTQNQTLSFGKFKGKLFSETPAWYQQWLLKQDWFNKQNDEPKPPKRPAYWDGYSRKGQAWEMEHFEFEMKMAEKQDKTWSWLYEGI